MRGYIYRPGTANHLNTKCHHCGYSASFGSFLKLQFPELYKEFVVAQYQETSKAHVPHMDLKSILAIPKTKVELTDASLDGLKQCSNLKDTHPVAKFLSKRQIPKDKWNLLYYTTKFKEYTNSLLKDKFKDIGDTDHPRLIIPYLDMHGKMFAYSARAFGKQEPKYFTIKLDDRERIFGLDRLDNTKGRVYALEGPLDSLFIPNSIAVSGSSFDCDTLRALKSVVTLVPDNEPRSPEICALIKKHIKLGYRVCMLPHAIKTKDINEHVLSGMTPRDIIDMIEANTFSGVEALLKFTYWKLT